MDTNAFIATNNHPQETPYDFDCQELKRKAIGIDIDNFEQEYLNAFQ